MKRMLVPTDFSDCAQAAADVAIAIARKTKAEIYFLHLHAPEPAGGHMAMHGGGTQQVHHHHDCTGPARAKLDELVKKAEHQGLLAKPVVVMDESKEQLIKHIEAFNIDLVVMGSHGVTGLKEYFIGSITQYVMRHTRVPVLVIKKKLPQFNPRRIVFASRFAEINSESLEFINDFTLLWNAVVDLLFINTQESETNVPVTNMNRYQSLLKANPVIFKSPDEEIGIRKYLTQENVDLLIVTSQNEMRLKNLFFTSIAGKLVNHEEHPVLVIPVVE